MSKNIIFDSGNVLVSFRWKEYYREFNYSEDIVVRLEKATVLSPQWNEFDRGEQNDDEILKLFVANDEGIKTQIYETLSNIKNLLGKYDMLFHGFRN